ncbi:MAG: hypothetical protein R3C13_02380 [Hyphomonas sp.]|uniref:hypothetical protein n=1 Tax=Hyphomonas sp. TaxID=87 RepID=UPI003529C6CD
MRQALCLALAAGLVACGKPAPPPEAPDVSVTEPAAPGADEIVKSPYEIGQPSEDDVDYAALAAYPAGWHVSTGWPGEYPAGFVVLDPGVKVAGRARPNPDEPASLTCPLPEYANYQIWNQPRVAADDLIFIVATKTVPVTMTADASIEYPTDNGMKVLELKRGDVLSYLRYLGEGFAIFGFNDAEYDINEAELRDISDLTAGVVDEDQWVDVTCMDGTRAWLLYDEVIAHDSIVPSPIVGFGEASDIYPDEVERVREDGLQAEALSDEPFDGGTGD